VQLDVETFEELESAGDWEAAAALVAGDFLEGFSIKDAWAFEEWLGSERQQWRRRSVVALAHYGETLLAAGQTPQAIEVSLRAHSLDPGSNTALQVVLKSLALAGERSDALARYEEYRKRLAEVGTEPDSATLALVERVRKERSWSLHESVPTKAEEGAALRRVPLVGRDEELARLVSAWADATAAGHAFISAIEGEPGCGKTRLAEEFTARVRLDGATVATIRAVEADIDQPGSAILGLARGGLLYGPGLAAASPAALGTFSSQIDDWADRFGQPKGEQMALGPAMIEVVRAISREQPTFLLVDDAHWCDKETLLALWALLRDLSDMAVHVCVSLAPQPPRAELDELRSRLGRDLNGIIVHAEKLDEPDLKQLVRWAVPDYSDDQVDRLMRRVASDSAGLPLLAVELLHAVALGLDLEETQGAWPQPFRTLSQTLPGNLPDTIVAAIRVGFRRLSKPAQQLLAAAAVLGERVTAEQLSSAAGLTGNELDSALDELEWQRWLVADSRGYSLLARIVRQVVEQDMVTEGQKRRIREAVGQ